MPTRFDWKAVYFHLVSIIAIITLLVAAINTGQAVLMLIFPRLSMSPYDWEEVESFQAYKRGHHETAVVPVRNAGDTTATRTAPMTEQELRDAWQEHRTLAIEAQKRRGLWNLMEAMVVVVVALPVFWWHRRAAKRMRPGEAETE